MQCFIHFYLHEVNILTIHSLSRLRLPHNPGPRSHCQGSILGVDTVEAGDHMARVRPDVPVLHHGNGVGDQVGGGQCWVWAGLGLCPLQLCGMSIPGPVYL